MAGDIVIAAPCAPGVLRELQFDHMVPRASSLEDLSRGFEIRNIASRHHQGGASHLLNRMYARRGYLHARLPDTTVAHHVTLAAADHNATVGTLSIGFDGPDGLLVDQLFDDITSELRAQGKSLCEFTKLAVDTGLHSKRVLASLFHVAHSVAYRTRGCDMVLIEVNPRHVKYYERMLGFKVMGPEKHNPRVDAPGLLLGLDLSYAQDQIDRFGGLRDNAAGERSLYPYFFPTCEESVVIDRLNHLAGDGHRRAPRRAPPARNASTYAA